MKIAVIIPSRERPQQFLQSINMMIESCANPKNLYFYVIVDDDDPDKETYQKMIENKHNIFLCIATPNQKLIYINNMADQAYFDGCDAFLFHADDALFHQHQCQNWDIILQKK